jgi:hypothetical protein
MRVVFFKLNDDSFVSFNTNSNQYELDQEDPFGIAYRTQCSSTLSENQINDWWDYVDLLLEENPVDNFQSVWKIVEDGLTYGYEN